MSTVERFRQAVEGALGDRRPVSVAEKAGLPRDAIWRVLRGGNPSLARAGEIAESLGLEIRVEKGSLAKSPAVTTTIATDDIAALAITLREILSRLESVPGVIEFPDGGGKAVAVQEMRTAAGAGAEILEEAPIGYAYFRTSWLRKHGLNADRCCVISVIGDSMEPTLLDGCSVLLDRDRTDPSDGGIFVVNGSDGLIVKRLEKGKGDEWILVSDNPAWPAVPWPAEARIVGRVAWFANTLP